MKQIIKLTDTVGRPFLMGTFGINAVVEDVFIDTIGTFKCSKVIFGKDKGPIWCKESIDEIWEKINEGIHPFP